MKAKISKINVTFDVKSLNDNVFYFREVISSIAKVKKEMLHSPLLHSMEVANVGGNLDNLINNNEVVKWVSKSKLGVLKVSESISGLTLINGIFIYELRQLYGAFYSDSKKDLKKLLVFIERSV